MFARISVWPNIYFVFYLIYYILCYSNSNLIIYPYHNDARSPSAQISRYHNDPGTRAAARPNIYYIFYLIYYILYYYYYYLIIYPYHNASQRPSAQFSLYHNDPGTRAQLLGPTFTTFIIFY